VARGRRGPPLRDIPPGYDEAAIRRLVGKVWEEEGPGASIDDVESSLRTSYPDIYKHLLGAKSGDGRRAWLRRLRPGRSYSVKTSRAERLEIELAAAGRTDLIGDSDVSSIPRLLKKLEAGGRMTRDEVLVLRAASKVGFVSWRKVRPLIVPDPPDLENLEEVW
jgi:hypothetical protein